MEVIRAALLFCPTSESASLLPEFCPQGRPVVCVRFDQCRLLMEFRILGRYVHSSSRIAKGNAR